MPSGSVIEYRGKRGTVFRIKYADATGKQVMETIGAERDGVTRKQAEAELRDRLVKVERKGWRKPAPLLFRAYAEQWFAEGEKRRRWKPATIRAYVDVQRRLVDGFGAMKLAEIRPRHVSAWAARHPLGASTVSRDLAVLHAIFDSAEREDLIDTNPARKVERPRQPRNRWRLLEPHEVRAVSKAFTDVRARRVFLCLTLTGLRRSEVERLRWQHVSMTEHTIRIVESKSEEGERLIAIPPTLVRELEAHFAETVYKAETDYVFAHPTRGTRLDGSKWYPAQFKAALTAAGITDHVRPFHDQRHNALTNMAAAGSSPVAIMATAGHRSFSTTKRYLHLAGKTFQADADALELRLLGGQVSTELSTDLTSPEDAEADLSDATMRPQASG